MNNNNKNENSKITIVRCAAFCRIGSMWDDTDTSWNNLVELESS